MDYDTAIDDGCSENDFFAISKISYIVHSLAKSKGWHDRLAWDRVGEFCSNLHGEVSELWESYRDGSLNTHCDKEKLDLTCLEEELADVVIRAMDMAVALNVDIGKAIELKHAYNKTRSVRHGGKVA